MSTVRLQMDYSWEENQEEITNEIIQGDGKQIAQSLIDMGETYLDGLAEINAFIRAVNTVNQAHDIAVIRAFWIVNTAYMSYFRRPRIKTYNSFLFTRRHHLRKEMARKKIESGNL